MKSYPKKVSVLGRVRKCLEFLRENNIENKVIVDVGSTFGWLAQEIKVNKPKRYIGIEPNSDAVLYASKNVKYAEFHEGYAASLPVSDSIADIVTIFDVIEHVPANSEVQVFKEINRVLKKDGVLLLTTPYDHIVTKLFDPAWYGGHRHYSQRALGELLKKANFEIESFEVKGTLVNVLYMLWFYFCKWVLKQPVSKAIQEFEDRQYDLKGIATVFLVAKKIN